MKIVHVISSLGYGGAESMMYELISGSRENVHTVICLTGDGVIKEKLESIGVAVICIEITYLTIVQSLYKLFKVIREKSPDIVQTWLYHADVLGGCIARAAGVKKIFWSLHNVEMTASKFKYIGLLEGILSYFIPTKISCVSNKVKYYHVEKLYFNAKKILVINNGINTVKFSPCANSRTKIRTRLGISQNTVVFGMVARAVPEKQHDLAINAFKILIESCGRKKDVVFVFIGTDVERYREKINDDGLGAKVFFIDPVIEIDEYINAFDVNVLTSRSEGFGNVIGEAMACGIPCISTDVGAARELIGDCGVLLKNSDSVEELVEAMKYYIHEIESGKIKKMKTKCRDRIVSKYGINSMVNGYEKMWKSV